MSRKRRNFYLPSSSKHRSMKDVKFHRINERMHYGNTIDQPPTPSSSIIKESVELSSIRDSESEFIWALHLIINFEKFQEN